MARRTTRRTTSSRRRSTARRRGNPRNQAPGTRNVSTSRYGLPTTRTWRGANYAYPRGVGSRRGKAAAYPINTLARARNALARAAQPQTAGSVAGVKRALRAKGGAYAALANRSHATSHTGRGGGHGGGGRRGGGRRR